MARPIAPVSESERMMEKQVIFGTQRGSAFPYLRLKNMLVNVVRIRNTVDQKNGETYNATIENMTSRSIENCSSS